MPLLFEPELDDDIGIPPFPSVVRPWVVVEVEGVVTIMGVSGVSEDPLLDRVDLPLLD